MHQQGNSTDPESIQSDELSLLRTELFSKITLSMLFEELMRRVSEAPWAGKCQILEGVSIGIAYVTGSER